MSINVRYPRFTFHSHNKLATASFLIFSSGFLPVLANDAVPQSRTITGTVQPTVQAPILNENTSEAIPNQYIVVFKKDTTRKDILAAQKTVKALGGKVGFTYTSALMGFSVTMPAKNLEKLRAIPKVDYIEADQKVSIDAIVNQPPNPITNPPTGLDRITNPTRLLPLDNLYTYDGYGAGVHAYVIDTGIKQPPTHMDFGGRVTGGADFIGGGTSDCNGHGTHVAGTIGGNIYGVAKQVSLHPIRVLDCGGTGTWAGVIAGVDWVTTNAVHPAVANMSLGGGLSPAVNTAVANSIASGVTYAVAAGNNNVDACGVSPASVPTAITVSAIDPANDTRPTPPAYSWGANWGTCLDLFAPGVGILSTGIATTTATAIKSGTSMAAPHVAGVAARYLSSFPSKTPAQVWARIDLIANAFPLTSGWPGIINPGAGSPNKLLMWLALDDTYDNGDPHIKSVGGKYYDFQSAGEFIALRDGNGTQIQTRQTPVETGGATCVSVNTAVAAKVGTHRVTYQPNISGVPDPSGLQLRVDGILQTLGANGINLGVGARVSKASVGNGITIDFPDGTELTVIPGGWWNNMWYLNLSVFHTPASEGIMGTTAQGSWLPALPGGISAGPMPATPHGRYLSLYETFADAWRVTDSTSLFDYAEGTSTETFTLDSWPMENPPCTIPKSEAIPLKPIPVKEAQKICAKLVDRNRKANCTDDVAITGNPGFVKTYLLSEQIEIGSTTTIVNDNKDPTLPNESVTFTATVARNAALTQKGGIPTGTVQFTLDGKDEGKPVKLDAKGQAWWKTTTIKLGNHQVSARYIPAKGSVFLTSSSLDEPHRVGSEVGIDF